MIEEALIYGILALGGLTVLVTIVASVVGLIQSERSYRAKHRAKHQDEGSL